MTNSAALTSSRLTLRTPGQTTTSASPPTTSQHNWRSTSETWGALAAGAGEPGGGGEDAEREGEGEAPGRREVAAEAGAEAEAEVDPKR